MCYFCFWFLPGHHDTARDEAHVRVTSSSSSSHSSPFFRILSFHKDVISTLTLTHPVSTTNKIHAGPPSFPLTSFSLTVFLTLWAPSKTRNRSDFIFSLPLLLAACTHTHTLTDRAPLGGTRHKIDTPKAARVTLLFFSSFFSFIPCLPFSFNTGNAQKPPFSTQETQKKRKDRHHGHKAQCIHAAHPPFFPFSLPPPSTQPQSSPTPPSPQASEGGRESGRTNRSSLSTPPRATGGSSSSRPAFPSSQSPSRPPPSRASPGCRASCP